MTRSRYATRVFVLAFHRLTGCMGLCWRGRRQILSELLEYEVEEVGGGEQEGGTRRRDVLRAAAERTAMALWGVSKAITAGVGHTGTSMGVGKGACALKARSSSGAVF